MKQRKQEKQKVSIKELEDYENQLQREVAEIQKKFEKEEILDSFDLVDKKNEKLEAIILHNTWLMQKRIRNLMKKKQIGF